MAQENQPTQADEPAPKGTWALLSLVALGMTLGWLFLYFGVFLPRGAVH